MQLRARALPHFLPRFFGSWWLSLTQVGSEVAITDMFLVRLLLARLLVRSFLEKESWVLLWAEQRRGRATRTTTHRAALQQRGYSSKKRKKVEWGSLLQSQQKFKNQAHWKKQDFFYICSIFLAWLSTKIFRRRGWKMKFGRIWLWLSIFSYAEAPPGGQITYRFHYAP